jgi:hypothetical protein
MKKYLVVLIALFLFSCTGTIYTAKTEKEGMKGSYEEPALRELANRNQDLLSQIYSRYSRSRVDIYPGGIGFTTLRGLDSSKHAYLLVSVRPAEVYFDEVSTKPEQRFSKVLQVYMEKYMGFLNAGDLDRNGVEGLAFGIYWPVRDYSQCDQYGGFLEYITVYLPKEDAQDLLNKRRSFRESLEDAEIYTSLEMKPAVSVRPVF